MTVCKHCGKEIVPYTRFHYIQGWWEHEATGMIVCEITRAEPEVEEVDRKCACTGRPCYDCSIIGEK